MTSLIVSLFAMMSATGTSSAEEKQAVPEAINQYFSALEAVYREGSTEADISAFLALMSDDVRYIHRNYDADFDLESWREAFHRNHSRGAYAATPEACMAITNYIAGRGYHAIENTDGMLESGDCKAGNGERRLVIFGLGEGKIRLVEELW